MKRTATLVAGLLLVTGTVFAAPTFTTTGEVVYENIIFTTDAATLQNKNDNGDTQALKLDVMAKFAGNNSLQIVADEGNDPTLKVEFVNTGKENVFTATALSDDGETGLFEKVTMGVVHTKGKVKAQVKGNLEATLYGATATGKHTFNPDKGSDAIYLQYQVTPSVQTTFYPWATTFGVDSVFNDDGATSEILGIKDGRQADKDYTSNESVSEDTVAGIKVAMTEGALKGLEVKVGTSLDNTKDTTFYVDAMYAKTIGTLALKGDFAMTTDKSDAVKQTLMLDAKTKVSTVDLQGQLFQATGKVAADDVTAVYAKATTKVSAVDVLAEASAKKLGTKAAINGVYVEGAYTAAEINGIAPKFIVSFKDVDLKEKSVDATVTAKVEAKIVQDGITVTPSLEIASGNDTTTTGSVKVAYSF